MRNGMIIDEFGTKEWYQNDQRHRIDGPAVEHTDGTKQWFQNGRRHRTNGPAVERVNGDRIWYFEGRLHRTAGPAVEYSNFGKVLVKDWYFEGKQYDFNDWLELVTTTEAQKTMMRLQYA